MLCFGVVFSMFNQAPLGKWHTQGGGWCNKIEFQERKIYPFFSSQDVGTERSTESKVRKHPS